MIAISAAPVLDIDSHVQTRFFVRKLQPSIMPVERAPQEHVLDGAHVPAGRQRQPVGDAVARSSRRQTWWACWRQWACTASRFRSSSAGLDTSGGSVVASPNFASAGLNPAKTVVSPDASGLYCANQFSEELKAVWRLCAQRAALCRDRVESRWCACRGWIRSAVAR